MKRNLPFIIIGAVLVILLGVGLMIFNTTPPAEQSAELPKPSPAAAESSSPKAGEGGLPIKPQTAVPKAFVKLEEFGDYQCPPCGGLHPVLKKLKDEYGDKVQLIFYNLPLTQVHKNAMTAAQSAVSAKLQGKFWEMHDKLYESQQVWSEFEDIRPLSLAYAKELGLNVEQFKSDMASRKVAGIIEADTQRAAGLKIDSTPTLVVEGQIFPNEKLSPENLRLVIDRFLNR